MDLNRQPPFWFIILLLIRYIFKRVKYGIFGSSDRKEISPKGKTVLITGANGGIGKILSTEFARRGASVILACRNVELGKLALESIKRETASNKLVVMELDLSDFSSIRRFCAVCAQSFPKIDILINNAGIFNPSENIEYTVNNYEKHFAVNHLGHFLLTNLLLPNLKKASPSRVVTIGSTADFIEELRIDDLNFYKQNGRSGYGFLIGRIFGKCYAASKFANSLFTYELGRLLESSGVTTYTVCPGMVNGTNIFRSHETVIDKIICRIVLLVIGLNCQQGVDTILYCALSKNCERETGLYYQFNQLHPYENYRNSSNKNLATMLWKESEKLVGLRKCE